MKEKNFVSEKVLQDRILLSICFLSTFFFFFTANTKIFNANQNKLTFNNSHFTTAAENYFLKKKIIGFANKNKQTNINICMKKYFI